MKCIGEKFVIREWQGNEFFIRLSKCSIQSKINICLFTLNSLPAAKVSTTMERVTNAELANTHLAYGAANGNSREAVQIYVAMQFKSEVLVTLQPSIFEKPLLSKKCSLQRSQSPVS